MNYVGDSYWCEICSNFVDLVVPRFKLKVGVVDESGCAVFVLFIAKLIKLLGTLLWNCLKD